jgi:DnaK suppressor protein
MPTDESDLDVVRQTLAEKQARMRERVASLAARPERGAAQGFGKRVGDGTVEAISRLTEIGVGRSLETTLGHTERALAKIAEGSYGLCDGCGEQIPAERLRAMPDRSLCVSCAAAARQPRTSRR